MRAPIVLCPIALLVAVGAAGAEWEEIGPHGTSIHELQLHPQRPQVIFARAPQAGIHRSDDGGRTWHDCLTRRSFRDNITAFAVSSGEPAEILVLQDSPPIIYRSVDGCVSWTETASPLPSYSYVEGLHSMTFLPTEPGTVLLAWGGLHRSDNVGVTWYGIDNVPDGSFSMIVVDPVRTGTWWLGSRTWPDPIFRTDDEGATWREIAGITSVQDMVFDPFDHDHVLAGARPDGIDRIFRSIDGGETFEAVSVVEGLVRSLSFDPSQLGRVWAVIGDVNPSDRLMTSEDGGISWVEVADPRLLSANLFDVVAPPDSNHVLVAQDHGMVTTSNSGGDWETADDGLPCHTLGCPISRPAPGSYLRPCLVTFGCGSRSLLISGLMWSGDEGQTWLRSSGDGLYRDFAANQLVPDPFNPSAVYANGQAQTYRSTDRGRTFSQIDTTPGTGGGDSLVLDPHDPTFWYTLKRSSDYPNPSKYEPYRSTDQGQTWTETSSGLDEEIMALVADPYDPGLLLAVDVTNSLFRTTDRGDSWELIREIDPDFNFQYPEIRFDPTTPGRIYVLKFGPATPEVGDAQYPAVFAQPGALDDL